MNGALDCDGWFTISGGYLVAAGSAGMAEAPDESSAQYSLLLNLNTVQQAGTLVHIQTSDGNEILTFAPTKQYQSIVLSSPNLSESTAYEVYLGVSSTGTVNDSLYQDGIYTPGSLYVSFTINDVVTRIGSNPR